MEVRKKIKNYALSEEKEQKLLATLQAEKFLDEKRFTESFVSGKHRLKYWGRLKIRMELLKRGIEEKTIEKTISATIEQEDYKKVIKELLVKKSNLITMTDSLEKRNKLYTFLLNKGYESELIQEQLNNLKYEF